MSKQDKILKKRMESEPNPKLDDILNRKVLDRHINNGIVKVATHDTLPLYLYDYSTLCERRNSWDGVTTVTRGLIRDNKGVVVARPMRKFFSYGGRSTSALPAPRWTDEWYGTEKVDGTMIIAANYGGELLLATRGSFTGRQLDAARLVWPEGILPAIGETWILEYVGPDNKIVVDYAESKLIIITVVNNWTGAEDDGEDLPIHPAFFAFEAVNKYSAETLEELRTKETDDGSHEGFVVVWPKQGKPPLRLKVKYPAYNQRHMAIFNRTNE